MSISPELLRSRLDAELAPLPVVPSLAPADLRGRADRRRTRRRVAGATAGVALLSAAAAVVALVAVPGPGPQAHLRPATPTVARDGDLDGDGIVDPVSLEGGTPGEFAGYRVDPTLVVRSSRYGELRLPLTEGATHLPRQDEISLQGVGGKALTPVDLFGTGRAEVVLQEPGASGDPEELAAIVGGRLVLLTDGTGGPFEIVVGARLRWSCTSASGALNQPGQLVQYRAEETDATGRTDELFVQRFRLAGTTIVPAGPVQTSYAPAPTPTAPDTYALAGADAYDECGTGAGS